MFYLLAPLYSLFSVDFYRLILRRRLSSGFIHLLVLSTLSLIIVLVFSFTRLLPGINRFASWLENELPPMTWTPEGLVMNARSPLNLVHPDYGLLATLDMTQNEVEPEALGDAPVFVTSKKLYLNFGDNDIRSYDLTSPPEKVPQDKLVLQIDGEFIRSMARAAKPFIIGAAGVLAIPFFFLLRLAEAFAASGIGMLINRLRKLPLSYAQVFTCSCYALTLASILELRGLILPVFSAVPFGLPGTLLVTGAYLFLAVKKTEMKIPESL
ncbi:MAG TPA: DUF1189 family protein [Verrucomicrobiae bacterium]|nr:DUF1189 family protein [Verrucomicrobiae bacterium]